jgi:hypothetical protein
MMVAETMMLKWMLATRNLPRTESSQMAAIQPMTDSVDMWEQSCPPPPPA